MKHANIMLNVMNDVITPEDAVDVYKRQALLTEIIDITNTQDLRAMQCLYLLAYARELRAWHEKLFG